MIKDAREQLKKHGIQTTKKVLVTGYSASGAFCWRWTMLHPEYVLAAACGGDHYPMLPLERIDDVDLIYPVGVYDVKQYTGKSFHKKAWSKIPIFVYEGADDLNDTLSYEECFFSQVEKPVLQRILPEDNVQDRLKHAYGRVAELAPNVQAYLYPNLDHRTMPQDMIAFLKQHIHGGPLRPITLTDTSAWPALLPIRVTGLYWGQEAPIKNGREYLRDTDLILQAGYIVRGFEYCAMDILHQGDVVLSRTEEYCRGLFGSRTENYIQYHFSKEELAKLRAYKDRTFSVRSHHPEILDIPENLTFTIK